MCSDPCNRRLRSFGNPHQSSLIANRAPSRVASLGLPSRGLPAVSRQSARSPANGRLCKVHFVPQCTRHAIDEFAKDIWPPLSTQPLFYIVMLLHASCKIVKHVAGRNLAGVCGRHIQVIRSGQRSFGTVRQNRRRFRNYCRTRRKPPGPELTTRSRPVRLWLRHWRPMLPRCRLRVPAPALLQRYRKPTTARTDHRGLPQRESDRRLHLGLGGTLGQ